MSVVGERNQEELSAFGWVNRDDFDLEGLFWENIQFYWIHENELLPNRDNKHIGRQEMNVCGAISAQKELLFGRNFKFVFTFVIPQSVHKVIELAFACEIQQLIVAIVLNCCDLLQQPRKLQNIHFDPSQTCNLQNCEFLLISFWFT